MIDRIKNKRIRLSEDSRLFRLLRHEVTWTCDFERAQRSRFTYRPQNGVYVLSVLGILNGLIGLEVETVE